MPADADNRQIHKEVFENTSDAFCVFEVTADGRFRVEAMNRAAEIMNRRGRADAVGKYVEEIVTTAALATQLLAKLRQCVATAKSVYWEDEYDLLAGQLYLECTVVPVFNDNGQVHRVISVARNTIERRRMQDALRASEQRSLEVFENASDSIYLIDVTEDGRFKIAAVNPAVERATGWSNGQIRGMDLEELVSERVLIQTIPVYRRCLESGAMLKFDLETDPPSGHRWFEACLIPLTDSNGRIVRLMSVARDVTERKQAEELQKHIHADLERRVAERTLALQLGTERLQQEIQERKGIQARLAQRSEELARINSELEAFSYSLSHDLRAPLRAIDGFTYMLSDSCNTKLDSAEQDYLRRVMASARRMNLLIDDMLKLFRMSRHEMQRATVDLSELAQDIVADLARTQPERRVTIIIEPNLNARADASLMRIALENLLSNAWKFTRDVPSARISLGCTNSSGGTTYFVRDNGRGFEMTQANKVFVPFQRLHSEEEFEGTGIGLTIVQRVIDRHGGRIWIDSQLNQGTTVYFDLGAAGSITGEAPLTNSPLGGEIHRAD